MTTTSGTPDADDAAAYLGETSWTTEDIAAALAAEAAAQARSCRLPVPLPDDLREALLRRVARNLAARAVPVATFTTFEGGASTTRVPLSDPEVRRLEGPWRRTVVG